jgi:hypothetical protein
LLTPLPAEEIANIFPTCEYDGVEFNTGSLGDRNVWTDHVLIKESHDEEKTEDFPKGRSLMVAVGGTGAVVLMDDDYWLEAEEQGGDELGRVKYGPARCFPHDREIWADGFPFHSRSAVRVINMTTSQMIDRREHSLFGIIATKGMNFAREWMKGFAGLIFRWQPDPLAPGGKPEVVQTPLSDTSGLNEIKYQEEAVQGDLGLNDADVGELKNLASTPYSMYALAKESTNERREPRIKEGLEAITGCLRHQLALIARFKREPGTYRVKAADGWEVKEFVGSDIAGETDVRIKEEPFFDEKSAARDATSKAVADQQLQLPTKRAQREYFKTIGVPESLLDEDNVQLDRVNRGFMAWLRTGRMWIIDPTIDDIGLHHQELGRLLFGDDGVEAAEKANWDEVLDNITGWEVELTALEAALPLLKQQGWRNGQPAITPPDPMSVDPLTGQPVQTNLFMQVYDQQVQMQAEQDALLAQQAQIQEQSAVATTGVPTGMPPPQPTPPPPPPQFVNTAPLREAPQHLVAWVIEDMLLRAGLSADEPADRRPYIDIRSAYEAYRLLATAQAGVAPPAPGAESQVPQAA